MDQTVPFGGQATLPDGTQVDVTGTVTVQAPFPPPPPPVLQYGPRVPFGPDMPWSASDPLPDANRKSVALLSDLGVQQTIDLAVSQYSPAVYLPAGTYWFRGPVTVPAGLTLYGDGSKTICKARGPGVDLFIVQGDNVRLSRMSMVGLPGTWYSRDPGVRGVLAEQVQGLTVDHCELSGFSTGVSVSAGAQGVVSTCVIHDCTVIGLGYGTLVFTGGSLVVKDCDFYDNRDHLAASGTSGAQTLPLTSYSFAYNRCRSVNPSANQHAAVDTHSSFDGPILIQGNDFISHPREAVGMFAGMPLIENNRFSDVYPAIWLRHGSVDGVIGTISNPQIRNNVFTPACARYYQFDAGVPPVLIDGKLVAAPYAGNG